MLVCQRMYKMLNLRTKQNKNTQHLVIPVDILNLVYSRLISCIFPNKLMEKMRKSRSSIISKQRAEITFFQTNKQKNLRHKPHCIIIFFFTKEAIFLQRHLE